MVLYIEDLKIVLIITYIVLVILLNVTTMLTASSLALVIKLKSIFKIK